MKADRIRAIKIGDLGLSSIIRNRVIKFICEYRTLPVYIDQLDDHARYRELTRLADECTVQEFIDACETFLREHPDHRRGLGWHDVMKKLVELGLTFLDWNRLPSSTVSTQMLKRLKKEELLQQSILVLNTLSSTAASLIGHHFNKKPSQVTIGEFLTVEGDEWQGRLYVKQSVENTRCKLGELGLRYSDGFFLKTGTRRELVESLMKENDLSRRTAALVADVAEKRYWVKPFRPEP